MQLCELKAKFWGSILGVTPQWNQRGNILCLLPSTALQTVTKGHWDFSFQFENITIKMSAVPHQVSVRAGGRIPDSWSDPTGSSPEDSTNSKCTEQLWGKAFTHLSRAADWYFLLIFSSQPSQSLYHSHLCTGGLFQCTWMHQCQAQI